MGAVDTNVLVRCIIQDDPHQVEAVSCLRQRCAREACKLFVPITVLLELEWVLRSCLGFSKTEVIDAMTQVLQAEDLDIDREWAMDDALRLFELSDADLADCMHARIAAWEGKGLFHTFDRRAAKLPDAELLRVDRESAGPSEPIEPRTDAASGSYRPPRVSAPWTASPG